MHLRAAFLTGGKKVMGRSRQCEVAIGSLAADRRLPGEHFEREVEKNAPLSSIYLFGSSAESVGALWSILGAQPQSPGFSRPGSGVRWTLHDGQGSVR